MALFASPRGGGPCSAEEPGRPPGTTEPKSLFKLTAAGAAGIALGTYFFLRVRCFITVRAATSLARFP